MSAWTVPPGSPVPPVGVRVRARLLATRVREPWISWAERDVRSPAWPYWQAVAVSVWLALGLALAVPFFALIGARLTSGSIVAMVVLLTVVVALRVAVAHTEFGRRTAIERIRRGWRAQPWVLVFNVVVFGLVVLSALLRRGG